MATTDQSPYTAAVLGPDILAQQLKLQQRQAYAQKLLDQGSTPMQGQMVGNHYVAPHWVQGIANMLKSYAGRKMQDELPQEQANLGNAQYEAILRQFGGQPIQPQMGPVEESKMPQFDPNAQQTQAMGAALTGQGAQTQPVAPQTPMAGNMLRPLPGR